MAACTRTRNLPLLIQILCLSAGISGGFVLLCKFCFLFHTYTDLENLNVIWTVGVLLLTITMSESRAEGENIFRIFLKY
jgi:hypothetical protein